MSPSADRPNTDLTPTQLRSSTNPTSTQRRASLKYIPKWSIDVKALHSILKKVVVMCTPCVPISLLNRGIANPCTLLYMPCCSFLSMFIDIGLTFVRATSKPFILSKIKAHYFESESECNR